MNERIATYPRRTVELYFLDFADTKKRPRIVLGANEQIVSVELGPSLPLRVWIESTFETPETLADNAAVEDRAVVLLDSADNELHRMGPHFATPGSHSRFSFPLPVSRILIEGVEPSDSSQEIPERR